MKGKSKSNFPIKEKVCFMGYSNVKKRTKVSKENIKKIKQLHKTHYCYCFYMKQVSQLFYYNPLISFLFSHSASL